jgi:hypothetical protein
VTETPVGDLYEESRAAAIAPGALATMIGGAQALGATRFAAPHLAAVIEDIDEDVATMIRAVATGRPSDGEAANRRLAAIRAAGLLEPAGEIDTARRWRA